MSDGRSAQTTPALPPLSTAAALARVALIGLVLVAIAVLLAYLRGWLTPHALTPARFVNEFQNIAGVHPGFRRNHAKGLGVAGFFESNGGGVRLSKALVFERGQYSVIGRFSLAGGNPDVADAVQSPRGLGLEFSMPDGELWRTAMLNLPVFVVRTPQAFYDQLVASEPDPKTGKPDPAVQKQFLAAHREAAAAVKIIMAQAQTSGFADSTYRSLNAFRCTNAAGESAAVRWILVPEQPPAASNAAQPNQDKNFLFDALIEQVHHQPLHWRLILIVAKPGDPTDDATIPWPAEREQIDVGTLTIDHAEAEATSPATDINFDPLVLPAGIEPSDDPLLSARSAVYSRSFTRREGETKEPSAITPAEVEKGTVEKDKAQKGN